MAWITLNDYAAKYKVSVSTLRRRIKAGQLEVQKQGVKYLIQDQPLAETWTEVHSAHGEATEEQNLIHNHENADYFGTPYRSSEDMDFSTAKLLLGEIKRAYMTILQEKEEQIVSLKHELADLNTLVRALERENQRLSALAPRTAEEEPLI